MDRRDVLRALAGSVAGAAGPPRTPTAPPSGHERFMWLAVERALANPAYPFGAVVVATRTGEVLAGGVNASATSPLLHGEIAAMTDYQQRHGNRGWAATTLYTTGEPCPMCTGALIWAGVRRIVWGSSIDGIRRTGIPQIALTAREIVDRAGPYYVPELLLGGVLAERTDRLFEQAQHLRDGSTAAPAQGR